MKYHVNPETGKVSPCRAKIKCRLSGSTGQENHFPSKGEAEVAAERLMAAKHKFEGVRKRVAPKAAPEVKNLSKTPFEHTRDELRVALVKGGVPARTLPEVASEQELIEKWLGGDREKFALLKRVYSPESELTEKTKESVSGFVKKGVAVGFVPSMDHLEKGKKSGAPSEVSEVDLIDELPGEKISLSDLKSGRLKAF